MKKIILNLSVILLLFPFISIRSQSITDSSRIIRVLTFNIYHGETMRGDFDLDKIAQVIADTHPDLVALQEVDFRTNRAKKYDLVTELGYRTNMIPLFGRAMYYDDGEYGEGILSNYTFINSRKVDLPHSENHEPRAALEVTIRIESGDTISFIGTHLDHTSDETDRIAQVKKINEVFPKNTYPSILAGDLNDTPDSKAINILEHIWTASYDKKNTEHTYPSDEPNKKIDYIMVLPKDRWKVIKTKTICDTIASDHCAWLVVLELLEK